MLTDQIRRAISAFRAEQCPPPVGYTSPDSMSALPSNTPMLIGYSGGIASSVLLFLAHFIHLQHNAPLYLCHLHHGIRGEEADRDADFARNVADAYGIPAFIVHGDIPTIAAESGESIETAARRVRYETFEALMREHHIPILLTAHNADDTLETMLFHLLRGSGLTGLTGIPPVRPIGEHGTLLRPLINTPRREIEEFAQRYNIPYVEDSTNSDTLYTRNKLRREVIPKLCEILPSAVSNAARSASLLREDRAYLDSAAERILEKARVGTALERNSIQNIEDPMLSRVLLRYWKERIPDLDRYGEIHLRELMALVRSGKEGESRSLPQSTASIIKGRLLITGEKTEPSFPPLNTPLLLGENRIAERELDITITLLHTNDRNSSSNPPTTIGNRQRNIYNSATQIYLCFDTISNMAFSAPELSVRSRRPGDKILCRGMHRSLRTLCNEAKLSLKEREQLLLFTLGEEILWIPGLALRDGIAAKSNTERVLSILVSSSAPQRLQSSKNHTQSKHIAEREDDHET